VQIGNEWAYQFGEDPITSNWGNLKMEMDSENYLYSFQSEIWGGNKYQDCKNIVKDKIFASFLIIK
jgi:hypothetical protein